jgi:DNA ligase D-like protein (predicted 3'-phosphoesterase)
MAKKVRDKEFLRKYREKRDFKKTKEPFGASARKNRNKIFVIQKHDASSMHYDFRIEVNGKLKSWAVPKNLSTDPSEKRLAIRTEDHPVEYADFEGEIPEDEYGGGKVIVWDAGTYEPANENDKSMEDALKDGKVKIRLEGKKLKGGYTLINTNTGKENHWLLIKLKDDAADARRNPVSTEPESVITGNKIEEIGEK